MEIFLPKWCRILHCSFSLVYRSCQLSLLCKYFALDGYYCSFTIRLDWMVTPRMSSGLSFNVFGLLNPFVFFAFPGSKLAYNHLAWWFLVCGDSWRILLLALVCSGSQHTCLLQSKQVCWFLIDMFVLPVFLHSIVFLGSNVNRIIPNNNCEKTSSTPARLSLPGAAPDENSLRAIGVGAKSIGLMSWVGQA